MTSRKLPDIGARARLDKDKFERDVMEFLGDLRKAEAALDRFVKSINEANKALNAVSGDVKITVDADTSKLDGAAAEARSIGDIKPDVVVDADTSELDGAKSDARSIGDIEPEVKTKVDRTEVDQAILDLRNMAAIELAVKFTGMGMNAATGAAGGVAGFLIDPILDAENAMARFEAKTGEVIPGLADMINNVYNGAWGESRQEVADLMAQLTQMGVGADELETVAQQALDVAKIMDTDVNEVLVAADNMVRNELTPGFQEAFDVFVLGQQEGANRAGDMLETFSEYSANIRDMGLTAEDTLNIMSTMFDAGIWDTDKALDAIREFSIRATTDLDTKMEFYEMIGMGDEAEAHARGEITGAELMQGVLDGVSDLAKVDQAAADLVTDELFGSVSEDFTADVIQALQDVQAEIQIVGDEAETAGARVNDTLGTAIESVKRTFQQAASDYFNSTFEFTTFSDNLKDSINGAFGDLSDGASLGDAISMNITTTLDDTKFGELLRWFIDAFTDILIVMMEGIADVLDTLDPGAAADLRVAKGEVGAFNLATNIGTAEDMETIEREIQTAIDRGVSGAQIGETIGQQFEAAAARGDMETAQTLYETLQGINNLQTGGLPEMFTPEMLFAARTFTNSLEDSVWTWEQMAERPVVQEMFQDFFENQSAFEDFDEFVAAFREAGQLPPLELMDAENINMEAMNQALTDGFSVAVDEAFEQADLTGLQDLIMNADTELISEEAFNTALTKVDELRGKLTDDFNAAADDGNVAAAERLAEQFGDFIPLSVQERLTELQENADTVMSEVETSVEAAKETTTSNLNDITNTAGELADGFNNTQEQAQNLDDAFDGNVNNMKTKFSTMTAQVLADSNAIELALLALNATANQVDLTGIAMLVQDAAALGAGLGGVIGVVNNSRSVNIEQNNYNNNAAQQATNSDGIVTAARSIN